jgi:hypothetical protein
VSRRPSRQQARRGSLGAVANQEPEFGRHIGIVPEGQAVCEPSMPVASMNERQDSSTA